MKLVCLFAVMVMVAADPWNGNPIAETYINLGAVDDKPSTYNCSAYAALFTPTGILHAPGIPDAVGTAQIIAQCEADHKTVSPLIAYQKLNIAVESWDTTKRLGFSWMINGVRPSDGVNVATEAISSFFMNADAQIEEAFSFYDDQALLGKASVPPFDARGLVYKYINLGAASDKTAPVRDCTKWANLFTATGVSNEPGIPPFSGTSQLLKACSLRSTKFPVLVPAIDAIFPVESWDTTKRVAFQWTLTGVDGNGVAYVVPSITVLYLTADQVITASWDYWNTDLLPPGVHSPLLHGKKLSN